MCLYHRLQSVLDGAAPAAAEPLGPRGGDSADTQPSLAAQALPDTGTPRQYLLCDEGGMVAVYTCGPDGSPALRVEQTEIYVNLLPEDDALRIKQGLPVTGEAALRQLLEDLGG